jgi:hypothetical protein
MQMVERLKHFVANPYVNLAVAVVFFMTGLAEGWDSFQEDMAGFHVRVHHGVMLYGFFNMLKPLPDIFEGLEKMNQRSVQSEE